MKLEEVVPWGRSLKEYWAMFDLDAADIANRLLGVGDGPASANAELTAQGGQMVSIDPIYAFPAAVIRYRVEQTCNTIIEQVRQNEAAYVWTNFRTVDELGQHRLETMNHFLADYPIGLEQGRYLPLSLPRLPFADHLFDLALVSHLLFLYSEQLSESFHMQSVMELLRVAKEVRIFPLLTLLGTESPYINPMIDYLTTIGYTVELKPVAYEFQKDGNKMMRIRGVL